MPATQPSAPSIVEEMANTPVFKSASLLELRGCARLWTRWEYLPREVLCRENEAVDSIGVVASGMLSASVKGREVGRVLPTELIGEVGAFLEGSIRSATLTAAQHTVLYTLPAASLSALRQQHRTVYAALLEQALLTMVKRVKATNLQITQIAQGDTAAPVRAEPSALLRLWRSLRPGGPRTPCPPLEPLLCQQPGLRRAPPEVIEALAAAFTPEAVEDGQILCMEGEQGSGAYLIASGEVEVLRNVRGQKAERLAALTPGSLFGVNTLIKQDQRTASCVAAGPGWIYRIEADAHQRLSGEARLYWRESLLTSLSAQIRTANAALLRATPAVAAPRAAARPEQDRGQDGQDDSFQELLKASGFLEGLPTDERSLEKLTVVYDADAERNRKRR